MRALRLLVARWRGMFAGRAGDESARAEMEAHLEMAIAENVRRGMCPDDARRAALLDAGGITFAMERVRDQRGFPILEGIAADVRQALRSLRANPGYTAAMIITLTVGIGANAAMFTIVNAVLIRPLPYPDPDRLLSLTLRDSVDESEADDHTYSAWLSARTITLGAHSWRSAEIALPSGVERVVGRRATASYFDVMGVRPALGRVFSAAEARLDGPNVVVLSHTLWHQAFGADSLAVGRTLAIDGAPSTIIGVMPAAFSPTTGAQYWIPLRIKPSTTGTFYRTAVARLTPGASIESARRELAGLARRAATEPKRAQLDVVVTTLHDRRYGSSRKPLLLVFAAVGVLLLIACANLATLSLARAARREHELALRVALGAGRGRLTRLIMTESVILAGTGALLGLAISTVAVRYVVRLSPQSVGNIEQTPVDWMVLAFVAAVSVVTAVGFGGAPALAAGRGDVHRALSSASPRSVGSLRQRFVRRVLVVTQMATALMLVISAGLVSRTLWQVTAIPLGFDPHNLVTTLIALPRSRYTDETATPVFAAIVDRVRRIPGVDRAAIAGVLPFDGRGATLFVPDRTGKTTVPLDIVDVGPGYLETIGARLIRGRGIDSTDVRGALPVAVITSTAARLVMPDKAPLGAQLPTGETVVGIVDDVHQLQLEETNTALAFVATAQQGGGADVYLVVRSGMPLAKLLPMLRQIVHDVEPSLAPPVFSTMEQRLAEEIAPRQFVFVLFALFAALSATLAVVGLSGLLSYLLSERTREIGVRLALGADARSVRRLILGEGMVLVAIGLTVGLAISLLSARVLESLMYQMSVYDGPAFGAAFTLLGVAGYVACAVPAVRASRVDPMTALRTE